MIKRFGEPTVEAIVRGWVANNPILINSDTRILESIAAGECDVGITNSYYLGRLLAQDPNLPVAPFWANQQTTGTHVKFCSSLLGGLLAVAPLAALIRTERPQKITLAEGRPIDIDKAELGVRQLPQ